MLPAIRANIISDKIWYAIGWLALWGTINILGVALLLLPDDERATPPTEQLPNIQFLDQSLVAASAALGLIMLLFAIYGLITKSPGVIRLTGVSLLIVGILNIMVAVMVYILTETFTMWFFIAIAQISWGWAEIRSCSAIARWWPETKGVRLEERVRTKQYLRAFLKQGEDYSELRIKGSVKKKELLPVANANPSYVGQLVDDVMILISKRQRKCFCSTKAIAGSAKYNKKGVVKLLTDQGKRKVTLEPLSVITVKRWAGVQITPQDLRCLVKEDDKAVSAELLKDLIQCGNPELSVEAMDSLPIIKKDPQASFIAAEHLGNPSVAIREAALFACADLRLGNLHNRVIPMLRDPDSSIRQAVGTYIAAYPLGNAVEPLRTAIQTETDKAARKKMTKAVKACEKMVANPYAAGANTRNV